MEVNFMTGQSEAGISPQLAAVGSPRGEGKSGRWGSWGMGGSMYTRVVQALVYAAVIVVPLLYLPWTSAILEYNKQIVLVAIAAIGLVTWLLGVVVTGKLTIRTTPVDKGVLAVLVATIVTTLFSMTPAKSVFGLSASLSSSLLTVGALTVLYFLAVNTLNDRGRTLRHALTLSLALVLLVGVCQMFAGYFIPGGFTHSRAFNPVGSLNALGILAAIALPLFAKTAARGSKVGLVASIAGTGLGVVVLAVLNWWVLWVVALAGMLAMIAFDSLNMTQLAEDYSGRRNRFALSRFVVPMVVVVVGAVLLLVNFNLSSVKSNFPTEVAPSHSLSWDVTKGVMGTNLMFGWGPENFSLAFDRFGASRLADTQLASLRFFDATSEGFNVLIHGGAVALLAGLLLAWCLVQVVARFGGAISESVGRGEGAVWAAESSGTLAALFALTVALLLYPFNITLFLVWYVLLALAGLTVAGDRQRTVDIEERPMWSLAASLGFIISLILVLTTLYFTSVRYLADVRYANALEKSTAEEAMTGIVRAIDLDPANDRYLRDASQLALAMVREEVNAKKPEPDQAQRVQNLIASAIQLAQRAAQVSPDESLNWANLGQVYQAMTGLVDNVEQLAEDAFRKASDLRPGDPSFDNQVGQMWLSRADLILQVARGSNTVQVQEQYKQSLAKAEEAFKRALEKAPSFGLAIYNLGAVYDRQGRVDEAILQLEKIAPYNPNEPVLMFELGLLYLRDDRHDDALVAMRRAVLLSPTYANARWYLALLLEEKGDLDGALEQLREIQKDNMDNEVLKQKIAQLEAGRQAIPPGDVIDEKPLE
jgi:tetratricopeptide (TPR) repeat protein